MTKKRTERTKYTSKALFPPEILSQAWRVRFSYFERQLFRHPILDEAKDKLVEAILQPCGRRTINLYGPTGAGKTTLRRLVERHFSQTASEIKQKSGQEQLLVLDALASEAQRFGWKDFYKQWLIGLHRQYPDADINFGIAGIHRDKQGRLIIDDRLNAYSLRRAATAFTCQVKPLALIIDEAPHMKKMASGDRVAHQMNVVKSLTDETETVIVLIGTYELLTMINQNGQQGRRSRDIHLRRYQFEGGDQTAFVKILRTLQYHLPFTEVPDLEGIAGYLYRGCLGCVGVLKPWLEQTLAAALQSNKPTITRKDLEQHEPEKGKRLQIAREIWEGEQELQRIERECDENLDKYLGLLPF